MISSSGVEFSGFMQRASVAVLRVTSQECAMAFRQSTGRVSSWGVRSQIALAAAALVVVAAGGCSKGDESNAYAPPPPPEVVIAHPEEREVVSYLAYTGTIEASEKVELRARVQGFLNEIKFSPGQRVKKDDLLFVIDKREYQAQLAQIKAMTESSKAKLDLAETTLERVKEAFKQGGASDLEVREQQAARDEAQAALDLSRAKLEQAQLDLDYCEVRSPIDGRVGRNLVDVGNLVGRGESTLLAEVVEISPAYVSLDVSESDVLKVRRMRQGNGEAEKLEPGQIAPGVWRPSELALADDPDYAIKGRVDYVAPQMDTQTGTLKVRTEYANTSEELLPGLFARVRFPMSSAKALLVPDAALLSDQQGRYAMVVNEKDEVEVRRVEIGALEGSNRVVTSGLTPADRVIVLGVLKARPGSKVTPKMQEVAATGR
jgi:RND family efflux transporter MFP subunit